jgi:hypothetical protein
MVLLKQPSLLTWSRSSIYTLQLFRPSMIDAVPPRDSFHQHVVELGQLATYIALDHKRGTQPKLEQAQIRLESLNDWHRTLPTAMQLSRLHLEDSRTINWYTKRSLLQLHMLFLGLFNEPYRAWLVELGQSRLADSSSETEDFEMMKNIERQCISAARQCARVMSLLQVDNLIRSHCWVALYVDIMTSTVQAKF